MIQDDDIYFPGTGSEVFFIRRFFISEYLIRRIVFMRGIYFPRLFPKNCRCVGCVSLFGKYFPGNKSNKYISQESFLLLFPRILSGYLMV